jgi:hypothetical protein
MSSTDTISISIGSHRDAKSPDELDPTMAAEAGAEPLPRGLGLLRSMP